MKKEKEAKASPLISPQLSFCRRHSHMKQYHTSVIQLIDTGET